MGRLILKKTHEDYFVLEDDEGKYHVVPKHIVPTQEKIEEILEAVNGN